VHDLRRVAEAIGRLPVGVRPDHVSIRSLLSDAPRAQ
jgi:hypothetical protein